MAEVFRCAACGAINRVDPARAEDVPTCGSCSERLDLTNSPVDLSRDELVKLVASSPVPVLVDLWAPWCGPCRMVAPAVKQLAEERKGELVVVKVNLDDNQAYAQEIKAPGVPTFVLYEGGDIVKQVSGALPLPALREWAQTGTRV